MPRTAHVLFYTECFGTLGILFITNVIPVVSTQTQAQAHAKTVADAVLCAVETRPFQIKWLLQQVFALLTLFLLPFQDSYDQNRVCGVIYA